MLEFFLYLVIFIFVTLLFFICAYYLCCYFLINRRYIKTVTQRKKRNTYILFLAGFMIIEFFISIILFIHLCVPPDYIPNCALSIDLLSKNSSLCPANKNDDEIWKLQTIKKDKEQQTFNENVNHVFTE